MNWLLWWGIALVVAGVVIMTFGTSAVRIIVGADSRPYDAAQTRPRRWRPATFKPTRRQVAEARRAVHGAQPASPESEPSKGGTRKS
jgi:hypothetical protein